MELPEQYHEAVTKLLEDGSLNYGQIASLYDTTADVIEKFKHRLDAQRIVENEEAVEEEEFEVEEEESAGLTTEDFANLMEHLGGVLTETANLIRKVSRS